jgi:hypothetical protein
MKLETAPRHDEFVAIEDGDSEARSMDRAKDGDEECAICDGENTFVLYEGDKVCRQCGHAPSPKAGSSADEQSEWERWDEHRKDEYSGFYGDERIKFVGGFVAAYEFEDDF